MDEAVKLGLNPGDGEAVFAVWGTHGVKSMSRLHVDSRKQTIISKIVDAFLDLQQYLLPAAVSEASAPCCFVRFPSNGEWLVHTKDFLPGCREQHGMGDVRRYLGW